MAIKHGYDEWFAEVRRNLTEVNMAIEEWQRFAAFDFESEYAAGTDAQTTATMANRFWWKSQNVALGQACRKSNDCWLPRDHSGHCQPVK